LKKAVDERTRELREANQAKDEFLALLAHELRNPLAAIVNAIGLISNRGGADPVLQQGTQVVERQARQMARLLDDLLDVSRISRGKLQLRKEVLDLAEVVENAVQTSRPLIESRGHQLTISLSPEPVALEGDSTRLEQVLANLLNNAAKYTDAGGRIHISANLEDNNAIIRVRDTGKGIPPAMIQRVFEPFVQIDFSLHRPEQGGLGIGLMLVRRLVEMHGGTVSASSEGPSLGSEFVVRLPALPQGKLPAAQPEEPGEARNGRKEINLVPRHVLIVEDNADSRETLRTLLSLWGHQVDVADTGPRGVEKALAAAPEVALVDIGLPDLDGYQVAEQVRANGGDDIYLIALTGYGQQEDRRRALNAGFNAHLVKPVDPKELARLLSEARIDHPVSQKVS
jgi:CheY-like chemotaxis protein